MGKIHGFRVYIDEDKLQWNLQHLNLFSRYEEDNEEATLEGYGDNSVFFKKYNWEKVAEPINRFLYRDFEGKEGYWLISNAENVIKDLYSLVSEIEGKIPPRKQRALWFILAECVVNAPIMDCTVYIQSYAD